MYAYLKSRMAEWLLCTAMGFAITVTFCSGFDMELPGAGDYFLMLGSSALLELLLELCSRRRRTLLPGILAGCVAALLCFVYARTQDPLGNEAANAGFITGLILTVCQLLVHLLTRSRPGTIALLLLGLLVCAFTKFLQFPAPNWSYFLFLLAGALMLLLRSYSVSLKKASLGSISRGGLLLQAGALTLVAALLAGVLFTAVIRPLQPPTQELRLIQQLQSMELLQVLGVSSTRTVLDPSLRSNTAPDTTELDRDQEENTGQPEASEPPEATEEAEPSEQPDTVPDAEPLQSFEETAAEKIRYELPVKRTLFYVLGSILLLLVGSLLLRCGLLRRWQQRVEQLSNEDAAVNYFRFFLKRIRRAGIPWSGYCTLREYIQQNEFELSAFMTDTVSFGELAAIYERCLLGGGRVSDEELELFRQYYREFYRNLRQELGFRRYWLRFFIF